MGILQLIHLYMQNVFERIEKTPTKALTKILYEFLYNMACKYFSLC